MAFQGVLRNGISNGRFKAMGVPGLAVRMPPIPEATTFDNVAFEPDERLNDNTKTEIQPNGHVGNGDRTAPRRKSIADIAIALTAPPSRPRKDSLMEVMELATPFRLQHTPFVHPFGNTITIVDDLFPLEEETKGSGDKGAGDAEPKVVSESMTKLVVWIVFITFMLGVAGAIILGAESFNWTNTNSTQPDQTTFDSQQTRPILVDA